MRREQIARNYRKQGYTYEAIAGLMGISFTWAYALCNDHYMQRLKERNKARVSGAGTCVDCGGPMTNPKMAIYQGRKTPHERCLTCSTKHRSERSFNERVVGETLKCPLCHERKPFDAYPQGVLARFLERRKGNGPTCRQCDTAARAEHRRRTATPCVSCGKLRNGASPGQRRDTGMCRDCWRGHSTPEANAA